MPIMIFSPVYFFSGHPLCSKYKLINRFLTPLAIGKLYFAPSKAQELFTYLQMSILAKTFWNVRIPLMTTWKKCKLSSLFHVEVEFKNFEACILTPKYLHINLFIAERGWLNSSYGLVPVNIFDIRCPWYIILSIENLNLWTWLT